MISGKTGWKLKSYGNIAVIRTRFPVWPRFTFIYADFEVLMGDKVQVASLLPEIPALKQRSLIKTTLLSVA